MKVESSKLNRRLGEVLGAVEDGTVVEITRYGKVVARIVPPDLVLSGNLVRADEPGDRGSDPAGVGADGGEEEQAPSAAEGRSQTATAPLRVGPAARDALLGKMNSQRRRTG